MGGGERGGVMVGPRELPKRVQVKAASSDPKSLGRAVLCTTACRVTRRGRGKRRARNTAPCPLAAQRPERRAFSQRKRVGKTPRARMLVMLAGNGERSEG